MANPTPQNRPILQNRQGALPLHLMLALTPWLASSAALRLSRSDSQASSAFSPLTRLFPETGKHAQAWFALLQDPALAQAVESEARKRAAEFLQGVSRYQHTPFARDIDTPSPVFARGAAKLIDYGATHPHAPAIVLIPSLINRYYILDLTRKLSFARYLRARGLRAFVVDWGAPSETERHFNCALYTTEILVPMAEWIGAHTRSPLILGGYCMGGLLALALAQIRPDLVDALALFATPWDFFTADFPRFRLEPAELAALEQYINGCDALPAETIHTLFHCANPYAFQDKLREFAHMDAASPATQDFLAVEHWVNDGVAMTRGVARDCLIDWAQRNTTARKEWHVGGQIIDPAKLRLPCFVSAPQEDKIVPSGSALALARLLRKPTLVQPRSGHVSMMVGSRRRKALWEPFSEWLCDLFPT